VGTEILLLATREVAAPIVTGLKWVGGLTGKGGSWKDKEEERRDYLELHSEQMWIFTLR